MHGMNRMIIACYVRFFFFFFLITEDVLVNLYTFQLILLVNLCTFQLILQALKLTIA